MLQVGRPPRLLLLSLFLLGLSNSASATIVRFETIFGNIDVRMYDTATPASVANFMDYMNAGLYDHSFFHRSVDLQDGTPFVIQGGGFRWPPPPGGSQEIPAFPPVMNEPGISNIRGTLSYAKIGGMPDSATSQWFFNLSDNSGGGPSLDTTNGGFTVFGRVLGDGMDVADLIGELDTVSFAIWSDLPVTPGADLSNGLQRSEVVLISSVRVLDLPAGDFNFDGVVDAADYAVWRDSLGSTTVAEADGNGDGIVDMADYDIWKNSFGQTSGGGSLVASPVPEPATLWGVVLFTAWAVSRRQTLLGRQLGQFGDEGVSLA